MSTVITFTGNLTQDPELRFTPSGAAVAEFRVAINRRVKSVEGEWSDGEPTFQSVKVWGRRAENVAESFTRGTRVNVHGTVETESWTSPDGEKRTKDVVVVSDRFGFAAADLEYASVKITKTTRTKNAEPVDIIGGGDPWATPES